MRQPTHPPPMEKHGIDPNVGCGTLTPLIYSMKLNLLMERETA